MKGQQIMKYLSGYQSDEEGKASSKYELNHQFEFVSNVKQEVSDFDNEGNAEGKGEPEIKEREVEQHQNIACLRSTDNENGKPFATSWTAAVQEAIGESNYDETMDSAIHNHVKDENSTVESIIHDEDIIFVGKAEWPEPKGKGKEKEVMLHEELEIPRCPSPSNPDQMAILKLSASFCIDRKPFDPATYEARDFYVADASGSKRRVPDSDIIRWNKVPKPDGTTSVESNARFVKFSDGSLQLLIGDEASDVPQNSREPHMDLLLEVAEVPSLLF